MENNNFDTSEQIDIKIESHVQFLKKNVLEILEELQRKGKWFLSDEEMELIKLNQDEISSLADISKTLKDEIDIVSKKKVESNKHASLSSEITKIDQDLAKANQLIEKILNNKYLVDNYLKKLANLNDEIERKMQLLNKEKNEVSSGVYFTDKKIEELKSFIENLQNNNEQLFRDAIEVLELIEEDKKNINIRVPSKDYVIKNFQKLKEKISEANEVVRDIEKEARFLETIKKKLELYQDNLLKIFEEIKRSYKKYYGSFFYTIKKFFGFREKDEEEKENLKRKVDEIKDIQKKLSTIISAIQNKTFKLKDGGDLKNLNEEMAQEIKDLEEYKLSFQKRQKLKKPWYKKKGKTPKIVPEYSKKDPKIQ